MATINVNNSKVADHLAKVALARAGKSWTTNLLSISADGRVTPMPHMMAYSYITPILEDMGAINPSWFPSSADGAREFSQRFCKAVLMLRLADVRALGLIYDIKANKPKVIWRIIESNGLDSFWVKVSDTEVGNMVTAEKVSKEAFKAMIAKKGGFAYTGEYATSSAGELKQGVLQLPGKYYGPGANVLKVDWDKVYDRMSCGAWSIYNALRAKGGKPESFKAIAQFAMRMAQSKAPCAAMDNVPVRKYTVIPGTFQRDGIVNVNGKKFDFADGVGIMRSGYWADCLNAAPGVKGKYLINKRAVVGMLAQMRPFSVCKQTFLSVDDETLAYMKDVYTEGLEEVKLLVYKGLSDEQFEGWVDYCMSKGENGIFAGKVVSLVFETGYENSLPDLFNDFNGQKTVFNPAFRSGPRVLNVAHLDSHKGYLSTQVLQSFLVADWEDGKAMALAAALNDAVKAWKALDPEATEGTAPSWLDFQRGVEETVSDNGEVVETEVSINYSELANQIAPGFAKKFWAPAYRSMVDRKLKGLSTKFGKCNYSAEVIHTTILPDVAALVAGVPVLQHNTENQVTDCFGNGSGNMETFEYCKRIHESSADKKGKELAVSLVQKLHRGITCVVATEEAAKAGEGWDFDGDSWYEFLKLGFANRYPKTHARGYFRLSDSCTLPTPLCVDKD